MDMTGLKFPKPESRKILKRRARRHERAVIRDVRMAVLKRDGHCRLQQAIYGRAPVGIPSWRQVAGDCTAASQWAHLHAYRRSQTRGQDPMRRHQKRGSLMLCSRHHQAYDEHRLRIDGTTHGADGPLRFTCQHLVYQEPR